MYKQTTNRRGRPWLTLLALLLWVVPRANAEAYVEKPENYSVSLGGTNIVYFTAPVYDQDNADQWISNGNLKVSVDGGPVTTIFTWKSATNISGSATEVNTNFSTTAGGFFDITKGNTRDTYRLTKDNDNWVYVKRNSDGITFSFEAEWVVPYDMLGKRLTFTWDVKRDGNSWDEITVKDLKSVTINMPAASAKLTPFVSSPMLDPQTPGKLQLPWFLASDNITKAYYEWRDVADKYHKEDLVDVNNGIIMLDANTPYKSLRIVCSYKEQGDKGSYEIDGVASKTQNVPIIHAPVGLVARPLNDRKPKVELKWNVPYPDAEDLTPTDFFEIQRSLTGKEEDFKTISSSTFYAQNDKKTQYTYVDSTLLEAIQTSMLVNGGTLDHLTYRVRRAITQNWGWGASNNCAATASCVMDNLHLLRIADYSAKWEDEQAYTVRVSWKYADEHGAVWDDRAKMVLRVISKNREGAMVDSLIYTIDDATERAQRYKIVNLTRSCVNYDIDMYVERGTSPINQLEDLTEDFFPIRSYDDWQEFNRRGEAAGGKYDLNARLYADITVNTILGWRSGSPYRGIFDGNGHTLTVNYKGSENSAYNSEYIAPFRYVSNATIKNLHVKGTISTNSKFEAGLVACVQSNSTVVFENCRSSVTLNSSVNGDATNGGFVALVNGNATVKFSTCKFDGSFEGANCCYNGGFVGWPSTGKVTIDNCLFAPDHISTKMEGCATWSRIHMEENVKVTNSYATTEFTDDIETTVIDGKTFMVLNNEDDWLKFKDAVDSNPKTNAILAADFTVHNSVAMSDEKMFSGIFDGNGHTLNVDINGGNSSCVALFKYANGCTIKNLHLTGKITGGNYLAGLVGNSVYIDNNSYNTIANCRVSVELVCESSNAGGFIGYTNNINHITDCRFDGSIKTYLFSTVAAAFIACQRVFNSDVINNCVEKGDYDADQRGMNFQEQAMSSSPYCNREGSSNNWTYHARDNSGIRFLWSEADNVGTMSASELASKLGSNWQVVGGEAVPKMTVTDVTGIVTHPLSDFEAYYVDGWTKEGNTINPTVTSEEYQGSVTIVDPNLKGVFYHKNTGTIEPELMTQTRQSSVLLTWNTDHNPIDYFRVLRRVKGEGENAWKEVATDLTDMSYEDTSVSPLATYEYKVQAVNDCEGISTTETLAKVGECKHTGRVEGYVRFNDGTSAAGIEVEIAHDGTKVSVLTDDSGYFVADELSYFGNPVVTYEVSAVSRAGIDFSPKRASVTFDAHSNNETLREISILNGKRFSGFVMYDGTSIPVKGANFKVNGQMVYNTKGKLLETEYDGSFSFRVLPGNDTIQVVMDGHTFTNGGYYKSAKGHNFTDDVANTYFYDATKVKLTGRVVGGDDQGQKPLMNNLSTNNLGDSLRIVLTLEGDNTSWLVYDNLNPNRSKREEVVRHQRKGDKHYTTVMTERKRMTIWPDVTTGEYEVLLPPVRWKVQQVYCTGYPTLFQEGQLSEVVDLTDCLTPKDTIYAGSYKDVDTTTVVDPKAKYHAIYNRIYHAPVEVTYRQLGYDTFDYFGDKNYYATELTGETVEVPLAFPNPADTTKAKYTFDYPVFSVERKYTIELQVGENYPYNNDPAGKIDIVRLGGGMAMMQNGLKPGSYDDPVMIDSLGRARFTLLASQTPTLLTDKSALKTVSFTVLRDGTYMEAKPLQGYVLNMFPVGTSKDILTEGKPVLFDILRDPPGAYSSNTLAKGATLNYTYMMNLTLTVGLSIWYKTGKELQTIEAAVQAPEGIGMAMGSLSAGKVEEGTINELMYNAQGSKAFSYTMVVGNNISTSGDPSMVGADADLYIGAVQNVVVTPMSTIRAVNKKMYERMAARQGGINKASEVAQNVSYGTVVKIAEGFDAKGDTIYLIRDVALGYGPKMNSQFIYSQKQILTEIIPAKAREIVDMMFCGTKAEAQAIADKTGKAVYWSLRDSTDAKFAVVNKRLEGHAYNDYIDKAEDGINYMVVRPTGTSSDQFKDEVTERYQILKDWTDMIAQNEMEKLRATDLLTNYDIAGAQGVNYSETYQSDYQESFTHHFPVATEVDYFGPCFCH